MTTEAKRKLVQVDESELAELREAAGKYKEKKAKSTVRRNIKAKLLKTHAAEFKAAMKAAGYEVR